MARPSSNANPVECGFSSELIRLVLADGLASRCCTMLHNASRALMNDAHCTDRTGRTDVNYTSRANICWANDTSRTNVYWTNNACRTDKQRTCVNGANATLNNRANVNNPSRAHKYRALDHRANMHDARYTSRTHIRWAALVDALAGLAELVCAAVLVARDIALHLLLSGFLCLRCSDDNAALMNKARLLDS